MGFKEENCSVKQLINVVPSVYIIQAKTSHCNLRCSSAVEGNKQFLLTILYDPSPLFSGLSVSQCHGPQQFVSNQKRFELPDFFTKLFGRYQKCLLNVTVFSLVIPPRRYIFIFQKFFNRTSFSQQKNLFWVDYGGEPLQSGFSEQGGNYRENTVAYTELREVSQQTVFLCMVKNQQKLDFILGPPKNFELLINSNYAISNYRESIAYYLVLVDQLMMLLSNIRVRGNLVNYLTLIIKITVYNVLFLVFSCRLVGYCRENFILFHLSLFMVD
eukprot:TRINITY_DN31166_c0_g1_i6.p1 TRINITY_DN31166_c0_g1~~TRINITY_DN31166_c0_g1_i6.p1  ORF type:complete len:272 (-),score=-11.83 TRINITY_DN31166_c0_g1_i6:229-1044(-)